MQRMQWMVTFCAAAFAVTVANGQNLTSVRVASGLTRPLFVTHAPNDYDRVFIVEQPGVIRILANGVLQATPFLDISGQVDDASNEQGLLGLAFDPDYANNGYFYVNYTYDPGPGLDVTRVSRFQVSSNPDVANPSSETILLQFEQPFSNHNGGWIGFSPLDGYLYIATGDGGSGCDPTERAQNINLLLGKMLRIDVNGDDFPADPNANYAIPPDNPFVGVAGADEIFLYGLRNPFRDSFDSATGDLYIGDVGQLELEEIDFFGAGDTPGVNYGWDCKEGTACSSISGCTTVGCDCSDTSLVDPIYEYPHTLGCSITGGYVYRGCAIPALDGTYFFADFCSASIWSFRYDGVSVTNFTNRTSELAPGGGLAINSITSFGEDAFGELYICDRGGEVFKIVSADPLASDCNGNGREDACDLFVPGSDSNDDGILDECQCLGDLTGDQRTDFDDFAQLSSCWNQPCGDLTGDATTDFSDFATLSSNWDCDVN